MVDDESRVAAACRRSWIACMDAAAIRPERASESKASIFRWRTQAGIEQAYR